MNKIKMAFVFICCFCSFLMPAFAYNYNGFELSNDINNALTQNRITENKPTVEIKTLKANTPVIIRNINTIDTDNFSDGNTLQFATVNDIRDENGNIIIAANSPVMAKITCEKKGIMGKSAKLYISDFHTLAVDGSIVPLRESISIVPNDKKILSIALGVGVFPAFLLMKGDNAQLAANSIKTVYTNNEVVIK
ncbi:hypothetical protein IJ182_07215 [bacterium]|nr:hypothetical protein [bacterium]